jgi:hypothetical protein
MRNILLLWLAFLTAFTINSAVAQSGPQDPNNRGGNLVSEVDFAAAQRSVEIQMIVEEIEGAGYQLDVVEGFEEEWEEEIWVGSAAEDVDADFVAPDESERFDVGAVPVADEMTDEWSEDNWEDPMMILEDAEASVLLDQDMADDNIGMMRGEDDISEDFLTATEEAFEEFLNWDEEETAELNWWEDSEAGQWDDLIEDIDLMIEENEDDEDLDFMEELYEMG